MRAVILSDSHGDTASCERAIQSAGEIDLILHLGDIVRDVNYLESRYYPIPVKSVTGNNDFFHTGDYERVVEFDGHRIFMCHGHTLGVNRGHERLINAAMRNNCSVALYGHTHRAFYEKNESGVLVVNPGSCSRPRGGEPSFAVLETDKSKIDAVIIDWVL